MAASEIDEIFASKGKEKLPLCTEISQSLAPPRETSSSDVPKSSSKRPETVVDPSLSLKRPKHDRPSSQRIRREKQLQKNPKDDKERFKDSRGTARRKTEDGYSIFNEDELGISNKGGDTPLCPFECNCCF